MACELYRHTNRPERVELFREDLRDAHLPCGNSKRRRLVAASTRVDLWAGESENVAGTTVDLAPDFDMDGGDDLLKQAGFF